MTKYKKYHKKRSQKYDKNKDGLITLKEYLDIELSQGPQASPGEINYYYQDTSNLHNYFMITFLNLKKFQILCLPSFQIKINNYLYRTSLVYIEKKIE